MRTENGGWRKENRRNFSQPQWFGMQWREATDQSGLILSIFSFFLFKFLVTPN